MQKVEYMLYGLRKGETERWTEDLLAVRPTKADAESVIKLAEKDGFHSFRIARFVEGETPDFAAAVSGKRAKKARK